MPTLTRVTNRPVLGGNLLPAQSRVALRTDANISLTATTDVPIQAGTPTPNTDLPPLPACGNPVIIQCTLALNILADSTITFKCFRQVVSGGAFTQIGSDYIQAGFLRTVANELITLCWYDEPPETTSGAAISEASPVYRVTANASSDVPAANLVLPGSHVMAHI